MKVKDVILNPELSEKIEGKALKYAAKFSWKNQARRHYDLAERVAASEAP
jgi:glycosyltransferase involved in cell wall biosynthesis